MNEHAIVRIPHFELEMSVYNTWCLWTYMVISKWYCANPVAFLREIVLKLSNYSENPTRVQYQGVLFYEARQLSQPEKYSLSCTKTLRSAQAAV